MIDLHNHLIPAFDDGAVDLGASRAALEVMRAQGVTALVATPHLDGSTTRAPDLLEAYMERLSPAWERFSELATVEFSDLRVHRGAEVMLDTPAPDLSDPRTRIGGSRSALVEFPHMMVPPQSASALFELRARGWTPVVAHPERYRGLDGGLATVEEWRRVGARLQINSGSLLGRYGGSAGSVAWEILRRGWADYISSDHHARGACTLEAARDLVRDAGGAEQALLLTEVNPARLLEDEEPEPVAALRERRSGGLWRRLFGGR